LEVALRGGTMEERAVRFPKPNLSAGNAGPPVERPDGGPIGDLKVILRQSPRNSVFTAKRGDWVRTRMSEGDLQD